jgi:hypothetical protein
VICDPEDGQMIFDDDDLKLVHEQLGRVQSALASLRHDVLPLNPARYNLMAEAYVDTIHELRAEINAYLGLGSHPFEQICEAENCCAPELESPDINSTSHYS